MTQKISCILVDDDRIDMLTTAAFLENYPFINVIGQFSSPESALVAARQNPPDALILDIDMPGINGFELRRQLIDIPACIFTTSFPEYAVESFALNPLDFLVKPFMHDRFAQTINRLVDYIDITRRAELLSH